MAPRTTTLEILPWLTPERRERFESCFTRLGPDACWPWTRGRTSAGYGVFRLNNGTRTDRAHRIAWALANGQEAGTAVVRHLCHNRLCVNPRHLALGTQADNMRDRYEREREDRRRAEAARAGLARVADYFGLDFELVLAVAAGRGPRRG